MEKELEQEEFLFIEQSIGDVAGLRNKTPTLLNSVPTYSSTMNLTDIHNKKKQMDRTLQRIKESKDISSRNKKIILEFYGYCVADGLSLGRILSYVEMVMRSSIILNKDFDDVTRKDIEKLLRLLEERGYSSSYKRDYKVTLKKFFKWLRKTEDYPPEVRWFKPTVRINNTKLPEDLPNKEEVLKLIQAANYTRDKAFIFVLYESGCRIGEILSRKVKHVRFDKYGAILTVSGKTGSRIVRLISSSPILATWIDNHPFKDNPEAPLWVSIGNRSNHVNMTYQAVRSLFKRLEKKTGIKKRLYSYIFRHSRATSLATKLTDAQMKLHFGWTQGSKMTSTYIHLSNRDIDDVMLKISGLKKGKSEEEDTLRPKKCPRCKQNNIALSKFCNKCGMVLDEKTMVEIVEKNMERRKADEILDKLIQNEDFKEMFLNKIKEVIEP